MFKLKGGDPSFIFPLLHSVICISSQLIFLMFKQSFKIKTRFLLGLFSSLATIILLPIIVIFISSDFSYYFSCLMLSWLGKFYK